MEALLKFLNENSGAITVAFTAIVTLSTVVYAILTWLLVRETRKMRHAQTEPRIDVTYRSREEYLPSLDIIVKNIGLGPAYDIKFDLVPVTENIGAEILIKELQEINFLSSGLSYLSPGQEFRSFFTDANDKFEEKTNSQILVKASYKNSTGQIYANDYVIDISELLGVVRIGESPLHKIAKNIEAIKKDIGGFASGFKKLRTDIFTSEDRKKEIEEREKIRHERRLKKTQAESK